MAQIIDPNTGKPFQMPKSTNPQKSAMPTGEGRYNSPRFADFDKKKERSPMASPASGIGDVFSGLVGFLTDHNTLMTLGYTGAGLCLSLSIGGYARVFTPLLSGVLGDPLLGWITGSAIAALVACYVQYIQIAPRLPKYDPDIADRMAFKLGMRRFVDPEAHKDSPTLLPKTKLWARNAHNQAQRESEIASYGAYLFEAVGALFAFPIVTGGILNLGALFLALVAVRGFETAFKFASKQKSLRLTMRDSQRYKLLQRQKRQEADRSMK